VIVLDASMAVELVLQTPIGRPLTGDLLAPAIDLHAPHLIDAEVAHVLRRLCARAKVTDRRVAIALTALLDLPLVRHSHEVLLPRAWELRQNLSIYAGVYVALAELLRVPLWTLDQRIASTPGLRTEVKVVS
jgi:predicted nucleic acid-binding protein